MCVRYLFFLIFTMILCISGKGTRKTIGHLHAIAVSKTPSDAWIFRAEECGQSIIRSNLSTKYILCRAEKRDHTFKSTPVMDTG